MNIRNSKKVSYRVHTVKYELTHKCKCGGEAFEIIGSDNYHKYGASCDSCGKHFVIDTAPRITEAGE